MPKSCTEVCFAWKCLVQWFCCCSSTCTGHHLSACGHHGNASSVFKNFFAEQLVSITNHKRLWFSETLPYVGRWYTHSILYMFMATPTYLFPASEQLSSGFVMGRATHRLGGKGREQHCSLEGVGWGRAAVAQYLHPDHTHGAKLLKMILEGRTHRSDNCGSGINAVVVALVICKQNTVCSVPLLSHGGKKLDLLR